MDFNNPFQPRPHHHSQGIRGLEGREFCPQTGLEITPGGHDLEGRAMLHNQSRTVRVGPPATFLHYAKETCPGKDRYVETLIRKLEADGITCEDDLAALSERNIEDKLGAKLSLGEIACCHRIMASLKGQRNRKGSRGRSRSRGSGRNHNNGGRRDSQPLRKGGGKGKGCDHPVAGEDGSATIVSLESQAKPSLWTAVEEGDQTLVQQLLAEDANVNVKYKGWSCVMKAAEEGHATIIQMLSERNADLNVTNAKGRSALSFAAAPSGGNGSTRRPSQPEAVRVLLDLGVEVDLKDKKGLTAKERLEAENPEDCAACLAVFENYEQRR